uniref:energy-coupling factor transporter transmembrane component T n=1 Tax=Bilophila wadsworthia TaxID=35833 RepID=UPI003FEF4ED0
FCLYLPAAVMIRFIPTFLHDAKQVSETLRIRGWRMTPWNAFRHPVLLIRLVFTPLLFRSLKTSEELGIAAELKGLGYGEGMRPYQKLVWKASDTWLLVAACLVAAAAVLCQHAVGWAPLEGGMR